MIGEALRLIRIFHDMKATELSRKLSISQSYLSEIENKKKLPSLELIEKYAEVFNTKPSTILFFYEQLEKEFFDEKITLKDKLNKKIKKTARSKIISLLLAVENAKP